MMRYVLCLWSRLSPGMQARLIYLISPRVTMGVSAVVRNVEGRVLVVRHTYRRPPWGFPSGMVGRREQPAEALQRELREELGVVATIGPILHADNAVARRHLTLYFAAAIDGEPRHSDETDAHRYVTLDELSNLTKAPTPPWLRQAQ